MISVGWELQLLDRGNHQAVFLWQKWDRRWQPWNAWGISGCMYFTFLCTVLCTMRGLRTCRLWSIWMETIIGTISSGAHILVVRYKEPVTSLGSEEIPWWLALWNEGLRWLNCGSWYAMTNRQCWTSWSCGWISGGFWHIYGPLVIKILNRPNDLYR